MYPEVKIQAIELCKGADRFRFPPQGISKANSTWRRSFGVHRNQEGYFWDPEWEEWGQLNRKNLNRKCPPARLLITVFAHRVSSTTHEPPRNSAPRDSAGNLERSPSDEQAPKRHKSHHDVPPTMPSDHTLESDVKPFVVGHGEKFLQLDKTNQDALMKLHKNLGHPDNRLFAKVLSEQRWSKECIDGASDMQCPVCFEAQCPKLARPAHLSEPREFNELI